MQERLAIAITACPECGDLLERSPHELEPPAAGGAGAEGRGATHVYWKATCPRGHTFESEPPVRQ
jgi:hypothetical protein